MGCIIRQIFHIPVLLDLLLLLAHLIVQFFDSFLLLVEFDYHLVLLAFERSELLLTS